MNLPDSPTNTLIKAADAVFEQGVLCRNAGHMIMLRKAASNKKLSKAERNEADKFLNSEQERALNFAAGQLALKVSEGEHTEDEAMMLYNAFKAGLIGAEFSIVLKPPAVSSN